MEANQTIAENIRAIVEEFGPSIGYQQIQELLAERYGCKNVSVATIFNVRWKLLDSSHEGHKQTHLGDGHASRSSSAGRFDIDEPPSITR